MAEDKTEAFKNRKLEELKSIGLITSNIVHGFNNALGVIHGYAELALKDTDADNCIYPYLEQILQESNLAKTMAEKLRIFSQQDQYDFQSIQIHSIVEEAMRTIHVTGKASIKITQDINPACGAIFADAGLIRQAVMNLCVNACEAMSEQGGALEVNLNEVDVDASLAGAHRDLNAGKYVKLTVKDTGIGMDQEIVRLIFEPFFTAKKTGKHAGLGLTVVQGIVKNHKGKIIVKSKAGEGSTFDLYLPLANP